MRLPRVPALFAMVRSAAGGCDAVVLGADLIVLADSPAVKTDSTGQVAFSSLDKSNIPDILAKM